MSESTDHDLVNRARAGDRAGLIELVRRWEQAVYRIAWRVLGSGGSAEDVRQTVFLRMVEHPEALPAPDRFPSWIRRCTVNASITFLRRQRIRAASQLLPEELRASVSAAEQAARQEEINRLRDVLQTLLPEERAILTLRFDEDLSFPEIAEILERPASTVKSNYARLLKRLHTSLQDSVGPREEIKRHV